MAEQGCGSYDDRPRMCRTFKCLWLKGSLSVTDRPDKLGLILDIQPYDKKPTVRVTETREGALKEPRGRLVVKTLSDWFLVMVSREKDTWLRGPANLLKMVEE